MCLNEEIIISNASAADIDALHEIETLSFPEDKAASRKAFEYRLNSFPQWFFKAEYNGRIVGLIDGSPSDNEYITDDLYQVGGEFNVNGKNLLIFGLAVNPNYRHRGIAHRLMNHIIHTAKAQGKKRISFTCKESLIPFYESFGYENHGISKSVIGNTTNYDMEMSLNII